MIPDFLIEAIAEVARDYSDKLDLTNAQLVWVDQDLTISANALVRVSDIRCPGSGRERLCRTTRRRRLRA